MNNAHFMEVISRWKTATSDEIAATKAYVKQIYGLQCENGGMAIICYSMFADIVSYDGPEPMMLTITRPEGIRLVSGPVNASDWINVPPEQLQDYLIDTYSISSEPCMFRIRNGYDDIEIIAYNWQDEITSHITIDKDTGAALREI